MQRAQLIALYAPSQLSTADIAERFLEFILVESKGYLGDYYARLEYFKDDGSYDAAEETLDLVGRGDLMARVKRDVNCVWTCQLSVGVYPAEIFPTVFEDPEDGSGNSILLRIDPAITRSVEDEEDTRWGVVTFLIRVAKAIGSDWFISGPYIEDWTTLNIDQLSDPKRFGRLYVTAWKADFPAASKILSKIKGDPNNVKHTTLGYQVYLDFPDA